MKKQFIFIFVMICLAIGIGMWRETHVVQTKSSFKHNAQAQEQKLLTGTLIPHGIPLPDIELINQDNQVFTHEEFKDHWSFVFFGYTQCPELCPKTLGALSHISQRIGPNPNVQYVFISITPDLDTPETLKSFFAQDQFKLTRFVGLSGKKEDIQHLAQELGVYIAENIDTDLKHLGHSGAVLVINPQGKLYGIFTSTEQPHRIAHDFKQMMSIYARG